MQIYGMSAKFGVIKIQTRQDIHFARLKEILDKYRIEERYRNLTVCIDKIPIKEPEKLLADLEEIKNVEITSERKWRHGEDIKGGGLCINIVTQTPF